HSELKKPLYIDTPYNIKVSITATYLFRVNLAKTTTVTAGTTKAIINQYKSIVYNSLLMIDSVISISSVLGIKGSFIISVRILCMKSCTHERCEYCFIVINEFSYISKNNFSGFRFCISPNDSYNRSTLSATERICPSIESSLPSFRRLLYSLW